MCLCETLQDVCVSLVSSSVRCPGCCLVVTPHHFVRRWRCLHRETESRGRPCSQCRDLPRSPAGSCRRLCCQWTCSRPGLHRGRGCRGRREAVWAAVWGSQWRRHSLLAGCWPRGELRAGTGRFCLDSLQSNWSVWGSHHDHHQLLMGFWWSNGCPGLAGWLALSTHLLWCCSPGRGPSRPRTCRPQLRPHWPRRWCGHRRGWGSTGQSPGRPGQSPAASRQSVGPS